MDGDKPGLLTARACSTALAPLGVPFYYFGTNTVQSVEVGAHGETPTKCITDSKGKMRCPTHFPAPPGQLATFNRSTWTMIGTVYGQEIRAMYNLGASPGLDLWGPVINLARDPRW